MATIRRFFDGTGPYSGFAIACLVAGLLGLMSILLSTNGFGWWLEVRTVQGHEQNGLVYYSVDGTEHVISDPRETSSAAPGTETVYYLPGQPADGVVQNSVNQGLDWAVTVGPGAAGAALFAVGFVTRARRSRRPRPTDAEQSYGQGISSQTVQQILARNREGSERGQGTWSS